jgi:methyl-accepting chemotaxis protein
MSLTRRVTFMLGTLMLLFVAGAIASHVLLSRAGEGVLRGQAATDRLARVQQLEIDLTSARNQINIWLQRPAAENVRNADRFLAQLAESVAWLSAQPGLTEAQRPHLQSFSAAREAYLVTWRNMQAIAAQRESAFAEQDRLAEAVTPALLALPADISAEAVRRVMDARAQSLRHRADPLPQSRAAALAAIEEATRALRALPASAGEAAVIPAFAAWAEAARRSIAAADAFIEGRSPFRDQGNTMSAAITALRGMEAEAARAGALAVRDDLAFTRGTAVIASVVTLLGALLCIVLLVRGVVRPLRGLAEATAAIAEGRLEAPIPGAARRDELGHMAQALAVFRDGLVENAALRERQEAERAAAEEARRASLVAMAARVEQDATEAVAEVRQRAAEMTSRAESVNGAMRDTATDTGGAAERARRALEGTEAVAAATEELSASVREISSRLADASTATRRAAERGVASREVISGLSQGVTRIGAVLALINDIASRTNLLALNATIEAARAGEAGKGFAVVASEVKALAAQTARATEEVAAQVQDISTATRGAVGAVEEMAESIGEIDRMANTIAAAVEQQAAATREIAARIADTNEGVRDVTASLDQVTARTATTTAQAEAMKEDAAATHASVEAFRDALLHSVRRAAA